MGDVENPVMHGTTDLENRPTYTAFSLPKYTRIGQTPGRIGLGIPCAWVLRFGTQHGNNDELFFGKGGFVLT